jgi:hypothetical protein
VQTVKRTPLVARGCNEIRQYDSPAATADPHHLGDGKARVGEVVQRGATEHEVKGMVDERKRLCVPFLKQDISDAGLPEPFGAELEELAGEVETDDLANSACRGFGDVRSAARNLERNRLRFEWFEPCEPARFATSERRVRPREECDLPTERLPCGVLVFLWVHVSECDPGLRLGHGRADAQRSDDASVDSHVGAGDE